MVNDLIKDNFNKQSLILCPENWDDYELIDFGSGKKLERFAVCSSRWCFSDPSPDFLPKISLEGVF